MDLHHGSPNLNHTRSEEGALCVSPADEVLHGLVKRLLRSSLTNSPPPPTISQWPLTLSVTAGQHLVGGTRAPPLLWTREGGWWVVLFHIIHTSTDEDGLWSWHFKELALFVRLVGQQVSAVKESLWYYTCILSLMQIGKESFHVTFGFKIVTYFSEKGGQV